MIWPMKFYELPLTPTQTPWAALNGQYKHKSLQGSLRPQKFRKLPAEKATILRQLRRPSWVASKLKACGKL